MELNQENHSESELTSPIPNQSDQTSQIEEVSKEER
jgi:hypothetical protein